MEPDILNLSSEESASGTGGVSPSGADPCVDIASRLNEILDQLREQKVYDRARETAFTEIHRDLVAQRGDLEFTIKKSLLDKLIRLYHRFDEAKEVAQAAGEPIAHIEQLQLDLLDVMDSDSLETIPTAERLDKAYHRVQETIATASPELDLAIAKIHRIGFVREGRVLRPSDVSVYKYTPEVES